ncbi:MAG: hypothetical protein IKM66_05290 [Clostridia bacterium]|nr:hypothetical protein [Clostridia bacterium]
MKKKFSRIISIVLSLCLLLSCGTAVAYAADETTAATGASFGDTIAKGFYNTLNVIVENLVSAICKLFPNPADWQSLADYDSDEVGFMPGRETYQEDAADHNFWTLGYASLSVLPEDVDEGKYNLGRDLMNKIAEGVYDDQRVRVTVIDDNSGEGAVVMGAIDGMGITSTDVRAIRKGVLAYCEEIGFDVASINFSATHAHSVLDTQGVSTEFFKKLFLNFAYNAMGKTDSLPGMEAADYFKEYFIAQSIEAVKNAIADMESGKLYFDEIDFSEFIKDKRGLIAKEDIPATAALCFVPDSGSEATYITDITCHATSFSASNGLVGSDYIYYMDKYIKEQTGANLVMVPGAVGQMSRDIEVDTTGMTEWEDMGASATALGTEFAKLVLAADFENELAPVLNVKHREIFITPENSILVLACEIRLVNNKVFLDENGNALMPSEMGYLEFGNEFAFAMMPAEFYPETFWDDEITNGTTWDDTEWPYDSLADAVEGVTIYPISITNDALGYVLTDNNFAFMGHIIGEEIADEVLSVGKHMGSFLVEEYYAMIEDLK